MVKCYGYGFKSFPHAGVFGSQNRRRFNRKLSNGFFSLIETGAQSLRFPSFNSFLDCRGSLRINGGSETDNDPGVGFKTPVLSGGAQNKKERRLP